MYYGLNFRPLPLPLTHDGYDTTHTSTQTVLLSLYRRRCRRHYRLICKRNEKYAHTVSDNNNEFKRRSKKKIQNENEKSNVMRECSLGKNRFSTREFSNRKIRLAAELLIVFIQSKTVEKIVSILLLIVCKH